MEYVSFDLLLHEHKISEAVYIGAAHTIGVRPVFQIKKGVRYVPKDEAARILAVIKSIERPADLANSWKALLIGAIGGASGNLLSSLFEAKSTGNEEVAPIDASLSEDRRALGHVFETAELDASVMSLLSYFRQARDLPISEKMLCQRIADEGYVALYNPMNRPAFYFSAEFQNSIRIVEEALRRKVSLPTARAAVSICYSKAFHATAMGAFAGGGLSSNEIQLLMELKGNPVHRFDRAFE
ncbi:hypothetical protein [Neorhizobium sp. LjRoot104]|uniref:hypothetical protein n=1 Tax=Neorhizobium sp. LjRoot104 TaxID=3342254 RepID=UPI003ED0D23B